MRLFLSTNSLSNVVISSDREHPLESLTSLYADLMRGADLTPSDEVVALLLLAAHQRNMRKRHLKRKLAGRSCCQGPSQYCKSPNGIAAHDNKLKSSLSDKGSHNTSRSGPDEQSQSQSSSGQHESALSAAMQGGGNAQQESRRSDVEDTRLNSVQDGEVYGGDYSSSSFSSEDQGQNNANAAPQHAAGDTMGEQPAVTQQQQEEQQQQHQQQQEQQQQQQPARWQQRHKMPPKQPSLKDVHVQSGVDIEQGWGRGNDVGDDSDDEELGKVTMFEQGTGCGFPCVLTPSSLAAELAPDMPHSEVAEICLGWSLVQCPG